MSREVLIALLVTLDVVVFPMLLGGQCRETDTTRHQLYVAIAAWLAGRFGGHVWSWLFPFKFHCRQKELP